MNSLRRPCSIFLVLAMLLPLLLLHGCTAFLPTPADICAEFLEHIRMGRYGSAYDMLHSSVRYDAEHVAADHSSALKKREEDIKELESKGENADSLRSAPLDIKRSQTRISREEFIGRYTNIFQELAISGFTYTFTRSVEGEIISVYDYDLSYESELLEDAHLNFRISLRKEDSRWTIEWTPSLIFPEMNWGDVIRVGKINARRGEILSDGLLFAQTVDAISVLAFPAQIQDATHFARQVSALTGVTMDTLLKRVADTKGDFFIVKQFYPDEFTESLESQLSLVPGVSITKSNSGTLRNYPLGTMLAHIIGYVGPATEEDLVALTGSKNGNDLYNSDSRVGKEGLEKIYETQLRGSDGHYIFISTADGLNKKTLFSQPAKNGMDVQLTMNAEMQLQAEKLLRYSLYGDHTAGVVIVLNPTTGAIDAMAAYPSYDLNMFARGMSVVEWSLLQTKENAPMFNRLTRGRYAPGSIFKPFTAAAALESGAMKPEDTFPENKERIHEDEWLPSENGEFGPWVGSSIKRVELRVRNNPLHMRHGMMYSDNIYFAYTALKTGVEYFTNFADKLGMNEAIPFDVPVSSAQLKNELRQWEPMLLAESAFGQGEVLITPLQAASMFSAFANGGSIMEPYMVRGLYRMGDVSYELYEAHTPKVWKERVLTASSIATIEPMLEAVVQEGTGRNLRINDMRLAAKTGTAQIGNDRTREISWLAAYRVAAAEPRLVLVMLEIPANDSSLSITRFEIAKAFLK